MIFALVFGGIFGIVVVFLLAVILEKMAEDALDSIFEIPEQELDQETLK